ncbi:MAG: flavin reductase [Ruminococcus sp.]|nr:flavin reductase [Ruminococcus sp.]
MNDKINPTALFNIGYGLYIVTAKEGDKDNACIVNAVTQLTDKKLRVAVTINKANLTHDMVMNTGIMNVNCLTEETPFEIFKYFGFQSGRNVDKFVSPHLKRSENGLVIQPDYSNSFFSLKVEQEVDLDSHTLFICEVTEAKVLSTKPTMTYAYYHANVKPKPQKKSKGWVCTVCGYVYEGDELPDDFICPLCKHGVDVFEKIQ